MSENNPQDENIDDIKFITTRVRFSFEFESPKLINCTEERTNFYQGPEVNRIKISNNEFKPHLSIYDGDGELLQFHGSPEEYFDVDYESEPLGYTNQEGEKMIEIDLPITKPLCNNSFRTLSFKYKKEIPVKPSQNAELSVSLSDAIHTYIYVKKLQHFKTDIYVLIETKNGESFSPNRLYEKEHLKIDNQSSYFNIMVNKKIDGCNLKLFIKYELETKDRLWFNAGIVIAFSCIILNLMILTPNPDIILITGLGGLVNTYLIITKGWIFTKDLDKTLGIKILDINVPISYTYAYLILIIIIFIEILCAIFISLTL
jgi:hypothetical protein